MSELKIVRGQWISIFTLDGEDFICDALTMGTKPFTTVREREIVDGQFDCFECIADDSYEIEKTPNILDNDGNAYYKNVGGRPRNIVKR